MTNLSRLIAAALIGFPVFGCAQPAFDGQSVSESHSESLSSATPGSIPPLFLQAASQYSGYPGVPEPDGMVPSAIMPDLPTGADRAAFPYDPRIVAATVPASWPGTQTQGAYYIDKFSPAATDVDNAFGYPDRPRATIPRSAFGEHVSYVEIRGSNSGYAPRSPDYLLGKNTISNSGHASAPTIWRCYDGAWVGAKITITGRHVVFDGCNFQSGGDSTTFPHITVGPGAKFVTIRNSVLRGEGTPVRGGTGQMINIAGRPDNPVEFVTIFNNVISEGGDWTKDHDKDIHAVRPLYWARYIWILENDLSHVQGDLVQTGNSSNSNPDPAQRSHYIYIAGNHMYEAFENALDNKNSYHVILSSNRIHSFGNARTGTAVILSNNDEGRYTGYHWAINNEIYDATGGAIRFSGDQRDEKTYAIGNYIHDVDAGILLAAHSGASQNDEWVIGNTIQNCSNRGIAFPRGSGRNLVIRSNTTIDCWVHVGDGNKFANSEFSYHLSYNSNGKKTRVNLRRYDVVKGNHIDGKIEDFDNSANRDEPIFATFKSLYGVEISPAESGL